MRATLCAGLVTLMALVTPGAAAAQIGNPAMMAPDTRFEAPGVPGPNETNTTDVLFAQLTAEGGLAEVVLGELATERAVSEAVQEFAARMVEDHTTANDELAGIAERSEIPLPDELNAEHQAMQARLEALEGAAFELAYMRGQVVDHQKTVQLLIWEIGFGQARELQNFASDTLPVVLGHLKDARAIVAELTQVDVALNPAENPPPRPE